MAEWLRQSTAVTKKLGPFMDEDDGKTTEELLSIAQADIRLSKNGGAFAQSNNVAGATHDEKGNYGVPLDITDTATLGSLRVHIHESGALPVWQDFMVVPANVWDAMFGSDKLQVDAVEVEGSAALAAINSEVLDVLGTDVIADSVAADGSRPTVMQGILMLTRWLMERDADGTTLTVTKEDGVTTSMVFTLDHATEPTSITRSS